MNGVMSFLAFLLFAGVALVSYILLRKVKVFGWKRNSVIGFAGIAIIGGAVYGLSLVVTLEILLFIGAVLIPPYLMYFQTALRAFINKRKADANPKGGARVAL